MKTSQIFAAALLGLASSFAACAQTPAVGTPGAMTTPGAPATPATGTGTIVPGQPGMATPGTGVGSVIGTSTLPPTTTAPVGTSGTTTFPGGVPARAVDARTLRSDQLVGSPTTSGSQSTRRLNSRTRTTNTSTGTTTTRP